MNYEDNDITEDAIDSLVSLLKHAVEEGQIMARMEQYFSPKPARLASTDGDVKELRGRLSKLSQRLGGPPELLIFKREEKEPQYFDTYAEAALSEIITVFHRCRLVVCRAHSFFVGAETVLKHRDWWKPRLSQERAEAFHRIVIERFWEQAESAYIRLASYWDRIGQLLDFVFFNIRQYERDGFTAVMDRIHVNFAPLYPYLKGSDSWKALRDFQTKKEARPDSLKWLLRRRNLLVHSLHLRPIPDEDKEDPIFTGAYNHLDTSVRKKLKPGSPSEELNRIHSQLQRVTELFPHVLSVCEIGIDIRETHKF